MSKVEEVRNAVLAWALQNGILANTALGDPGVSAGDAGLAPFTAAQADYFRTRPIVRVMSNSSRGRSELEIFARQRIAKKKVDDLTKTFDAAFQADRIKLKVGLSKPFKVDNAVQSYGTFVPLRHRGAKLACGSSVGLGNQRNAGTLTALARKKDDRSAIFGLGCNHVVGGCSTARPGVPVVVPGIQDVSAEHDEITVVGFHEEAAPMSQGLPSVFDITENADLACFHVRKPNLLTSQQGEGADAYDTPTEFATPRAGLAVKKWGRSTGFTRGRIARIIRGGEPVQYNVTSYYGPMNSQIFKGTVYYNVAYEIDPSGGPFSLSGDSGALVVSDSKPGEQVVGIVVAGSREKGLVLPIRPALKALKLELVNGHNA